MCRGGELHQLDLVELMLADQAAGITAVGAGLGAEAWGVGGVVERQVPFLERFIPVDVGDRHLRRRDQIEIPVVDLEQVFGEFRQLPGRRQRGGVAMKGGRTSVYPCRWVWRSSMKLISARSRREAKPVSGRSGPRPVWPPGRNRESPVVRQVPSAVSE